MKRVYWQLFFATILLAACSKSGNGPHEIDDSDVTPPVIEITTPTAGQVFASGSIITVTGKVTDAAGLYRGSVRITNDADGAQVKEQLYEIHGFQSYNFNVPHATSVTTPSDYTVTVKFEDHGNNITTASVKVKVNP
ncbi:MAG TPA: Ig-like domain-containing protein [Chitinophagaceae bacterium]